jgi:aminopeptidase N
VLHRSTRTVRLASERPRQYSQTMHLHRGLHTRCAGTMLGPFSLPGTEPQYERSLPFRFSYLAIDVRIVVDAGRVQGHVTHTIERVAKGATELSLDALDFEIERVELDAGDGFEPASYEYDDVTLRVHVGPRLKNGKVRVHYRAQPRRGLYFLKPDDKVPDRPLQVWSQCQDEDARHWFPCHDKPHVKVPAEFHYTVPRGMQVLGNGDLISAPKPRGTKKASAKKLDGNAKVKRSTAGEWDRYHYRIEQPLSSYLVTVVVGSFDILKDRDAVLPSGRHVPVEYWLPKGKTEDGRRAFSGTPRKLELFSGLLGVEYPFTRYTQIVVSDFIFGGMENTTATTMYEHVLLDERAAIDIDSHSLVAHELAHQWFGDWLTCRDWPEAWLNEGFATYFEHVDAADRKGEDEYLLGLERDLSSYLSEAKGRYQRPIVCRDYQEPIDLFDRHLYEKGSLVLHVLRCTLGDELFWQGLRDYVRTHAAGSVETRSLQTALEGVSGRSLDRAFDEWVRRAGHPELTVKIRWSDGVLVVQHTQTQKALPYDLALELEVLDERGRKTHHSLTASERHGAFTLRLPKRPQYVAVDPEFKIPGEVHVEAPVDLLRNQLMKGQSTRVRRVAAGLLKTKHDWKTAEVLHKTLVDERTHWSIRAACASSLGKLRHAAALGALREATSSKSAETRAAVAEALGAWHTDAAASALAPLLDDRSYLVSAAAALALGKTRGKDAKVTLQKKLEHASWGDIVSSAALEGLAELRDPKAATWVKAKTTYGNPARARRSAVVALARLSKGEDTRLHLAELLDDPDPHLRLSVVRALEELGDRRVRGILSRALERDTDGRVVRRIREAIRRLDSTRSQRELLDKVAEMQKDLAEMQGRLSVLEARKTKR